jgi:hypothetical protein
MAMCLKKTNAITFHYLSWFNAGDDFKMRVQSCTINAIHLSWTFRITCSCNINCTSLHLFAAGRPLFISCLKMRQIDVTSFYSLYHRAIPGVKWLGRGVDHPPPILCRV